MAFNQHLLINLFDLCSVIYSLVDFIYNILIFLINNYFLENSSLLSLTKIPVLGSILPLRLEIIL